MATSSTVSGCACCRIEGCTNPHSPDYNSEANWDDGSCRTCENEYLCGGNVSTDPETNPGIPGAWQFNTNAYDPVDNDPPQSEEYPCPPGCLTSEWPSGGLLGWGAMIGCASGAGVVDFTVGNKTCGKDLLVTISVSNPDISVFMDGFTIGGVDIPENSVSGRGSFSFRIPPGVGPKEISDNFSATYGCSCTGSRSCRAGVVASASYSYVAPEGTSCPDAYVLELGGCCHACCDEWGNCDPSANDRWDADNGVIYPSCYG